MIARWFPHEKFGVLAGVGQLFSTVGILLGGFPLALLIQYYLSWRVVMIILGTAGVILTLMCILVAQDGPLETGPTRSTRRDYLTELKEVFTSKTMWGIGLYAFCGWGIMVVFAEQWAIPFMRERFSFPEESKHIGMVIFWLTAGVLSPCFGYISDRLKRRAPILAISSFIGMMAMFFLLYSTGISSSTGFAFLFCLGVCAAAQILTFAYVKDHCKYTSIGVAIGMNIALSILGGVICNYIVQGTLNYLGSGQGGRFFLPDYRIALSILPIFLFTGVFIALFFLKDKKVTPIHSEETSKEKK